MKVEIGKRYILRCGFTTGKVRLSNNGTNYKFSAEVQDPKFKTPSVFDWLLTGEYLGVGIESRYDIVEEVG